MSLENQILQFIVNFKNVSMPYIWTIGLLIGVISFCFIAVKIILAKNGEERSSVLDQLKWTVIGIFALGCVTGIIALFIATFFN